MNIFKVFIIFYIFYEHTSRTDAIQLDTSYHRKIKNNAILLKSNTWNLNKSLSYSILKDEVPTCNTTTLKNGHNYPCSIIVNLSRGGYSRGGVYRGRGGFGAGKQRSRLTDEMLQEGAFGRASKGAGGSGRGTNRNASGAGAGGGNEGEGGVGKQKSNTMVKTNKSSTIDEDNEDVAGGSGNGNNKSDDDQDDNDREEYFVLEMTDTGNILAKFDKNK